MGTAVVERGICMICKDELQIHLLGKHAGKCHSCIKIWKGYERNVEGLSWGKTWNREDYTQDELWEILGKSKPGGVQL